jgi:transcriptional regulator with XRE-family HTH domain
MEDHLGQQKPATSTTPDRLWVHLGRRVRLRREQIAITDWTAANALGVDLRTYLAYERGERLIPADQLAALAQLFNAPVFFFFEDLHKGDRTLDTAGVTEISYAVATETERIAALVEDFQKLDFTRQQCLLALARALADDKSLR